MKKQLRSLVVAAVVMAGMSAFAQGTAFTYQGRLDAGGVAANGLFDLVFSIYEADGPDASLVAGPLTNSPVAVSNGLFTVTLDFGSGVFTGPNRWINIAVRTNGIGSFTTLYPRQLVTATPYAIMASSAASLAGTLPSANLAGTYGNAVNFNNGANSFSGNGSGLSNLDASQLATGTVPNARLGTNVAFLNSNQTFTAQNVFLQPVGIGNSSPVFPLDIVAPQGVVRLTTTNSGYGSVLELRSMLTNTDQYLGAINFNNVGDWFAGQIGYIAPNPTNANYDYFEFRVGGVTGLRVQADPRGLYAPSLIGGYPLNSISSIGSGGNVIAGGGYYGGYNTILSNSSGVFIGAGSGNQVGPNANDTVIGGGYGNTISSGGSAIAGGVFNAIYTNVGYSFIGSGYGNSIQPSGGGNSIVGGYYNYIASSNYNSSIGGGYYNDIEPYANYSTIGGGYNNAIYGDYSTYTNGNFIASTVAGGTYNYIQAKLSFIGGGYVNAIGTYAPFSVIGGGVYNEVNGSYSVVPGGNSNVASGNNSFAAGTHANALHYGSFVLTDGQYVDFTSANNNELSARFSGGVRIVTAGAGMTLDGNSVLYSGGSGNGSGLTSLNASQLSSGTVPLANLSGITSTELSPATWQTATNLNGGNARLATNVVSGIGITNAFITNSVFAGNGTGLSNLNASQISSGTVPLAQLSGITSAQLSGPAWQAATNLNGGNAALASNVVSGISITNAFITNSVFAGNGSGLTSLNASQLTSGPVPLSQLAGITSTQLDPATWQAATNLNGGNAALASNVVSGINITNAFITNSVFAGNGVGLTNLNANQLTSGIVPDARLSTNVALLNGNQTFSGANSLTNSANQFGGNGANLSGVIQTASARGFLGTIPSTNVFVFAGPTASGLSLVAGQKVFISVSAALGITAAVATFDFGPGYTFNGGPITLTDASNYLTAQATSAGGRQVYSTSQVFIVPSTGTYVFGFGIRPGANSFNNSDYMSVAVMAFK